MDEKNYSLKQLYEFVTQYSKEANDEGFDMSVGDFVDWIASRDEHQTEDGPLRVELEFTSLEELNIDNEKLQKAIFDITAKQTERLFGKEKSVLPEKLEAPYFLRTKGDTDMDVVQLLMKTIEKQNKIIDYLKEKNI